MLRGHTTVHDTAGSGTWFPTRELFRKLDCVSPRQAPYLGLLGAPPGPRPPRSHPARPSKSCPATHTVGSAGDPWCPGWAPADPLGEGRLPLFGQPFSRTFLRGQLAKEPCHPETFHLPPWIAMAKTMWATLNLIWG